MVRHIVSWNFVPGKSNEEKQEILAFLKENFPPLKDKIPGVLKVEVGMPPLKSSTCDACLYVEMENEAALSVYKNHPEHLRVASVVRENMHERRCCDFFASED